MFVIRLRTSECVSEYSLGADSVLNYNRIKTSEYGTDFIFSNSNISHVFYDNGRWIIVFKYKINLFFFFMRLGSLPRCGRTTCTHYYELLLVTLTGRPRPYNEPNTFSCHVSTGRGRYERRRPYGRKKETFNNILHLYYVMLLGSSTCVFLRNI